MRWAGLRASYVLLTKRSMTIARSPWTPDEDAQLQALAISGKSAAAIAAKLKRTEIPVRNRASKLRYCWERGRQWGNDQASFHCKPTMDARGRRSSSNSSYIRREHRRDLEASAPQRRGPSSPCSRARNRVETGRKKGMSQRPALR